jgi:hypothetical protein
VGVEVTVFSGRGSDDSAFIATRMTSGCPVEMPASTPPARFVMRV